MKKIKVKNNLNVIFSVTILTLETDVEAITNDANVNNKIQTNETSLDITEATVNQNNEIVKVEADSPLAHQKGQCDPISCCLCCGLNLLTGGLCTIL